MRLLYLCEADTGGIAEYSVRQVNALTEQGAEVTVLCRPGLEHQRLRCFKVLPSLPGRGAAEAPKWKRLIRQVADRRQVARVACRIAVQGNYDGLLIACYAEYFSPLWAGIFRRSAQKGLVIATIAHDPVRDFVLGPYWWHRWSVRQGYSFVRYVFVHDQAPIDFGGDRPAGIRVHEIPHGPFEVNVERRGRDLTREHYGFGAGDRIFLSFGQIRDGKNLDRFLRAMRALPEHVKLLVAGSGGGGSQRPPEAYSQLAMELGVADRCSWDFRYIPEEETGDLFAAADVVLMTYSANFRSASGVLNAAVGCRKPVLASSGEGPLKSSVKDYRLGIWVEPDNDDAIQDNTRRFLTESLNPEWERYERENSWEENARRVMNAFEER